MKKNLWKWVLGILLVVILVGAAGYAFNLFLNNNGYSTMMFAHARGMRGFDGHFGRMPFLFGGFFLLGGLFRLLLPLGLLAAFGYFFYQMGKRSALRAAPAPVEAPAPASEDQAPPAPEA